MKTKFDEYLTLARVTEARKNREVAVQAELDNLRIELQALKTVLDVEKAIRSIFVPEHFHSLYGLESLLRVNRRAPHQGCDS